jgi:hypothetical protein
MTPFGYVKTPSQTMNECFSDLLSVGCHAVMAPSPVDKPPLKKEILRAKSAKGKTTFAKHFTKAASERDRRPLPLLPTK